jgi:tetratricopeptide (TPR) repeat protein
MRQTRCIEGNAHIETVSLTQWMGRIITTPSAMMPVLWITASLGILHIIDTSVKVKHARNSSRIVGLKYAANYSMGVSTIVATYMMFQSSRQLSFKSLSNKTEANTSIHRAIDEFEQTDVIWKLVKSYSLIVVKNSKGSIHRLLSQALRLSQSESDSRLNLEICLRALRQTWKFKPEQIDSWHDSACILDHIKSVIAHSFSSSNCFHVDLANLAREAGIFSAMALNRFEEAKEILQISLDILNLIEVGSKHHTISLAATHFEMGKVLRYQGSFQKSEESLQISLELRLQLSQSDDCGGIAVAATLHELGVLEVKRHNLDAAANFLQKAIDLRRTLREDSMREGIEAERAATLHQLAAVHLARKPPSLQQAEMLLQEALALDMQIGQRAATLKQLARVAIRRGEFVTAEKVLADALNLYVELYGENVQHVNVAAVKFQQGSLAFHRDNLSDAWKYYSECLNIREKVYEYIQGNHIDISSVLHELGRVAFSQKVFPRHKICFRLKNRYWINFAKVLIKANEYFKLV